MSKEEERGKIYALHKASEKLNDYYGSAMLSVVQFDGHDIQRAFIEGNHQAEKDNELTWEDIGWIIEEAIDNSPENLEKEQLCQEVLKRFKMQKRK